MKTKIKDVTGKDFNKALELYAETCHKDKILEVGVDSVVPVRCLFVVEVEDVLKLLRVFHLKVDKEDVLLLVYEGK